MNELLKGLDMKVKNMGVTVTHIVSEVAVLQATYEQAQLELRQKKSTIRFLTEVIAGQMTDSVWKALLGEDEANITDILLRERHKIRAIKSVRAILDLGLYSAKTLVDARLLVLPEEDSDE